MVEKNMKTTREKILQNLLTYPKSTINELAEEVGINAISVRHHLTSLQAEGLVISEEERHGVGRPRLVYLLTDRGMEQFPTRYFQLTNRLLDQIKKSIPEKSYKTILNQIADNTAGDILEKVEYMSFEQKLDSARELLAREGFSMVWEKIGDEYLIHEISCPYLQIVQNHPEICTIGQRLISTILATSITKTRCMVNGDTQCTFTIQKAALSEGLNI